MSEEFLPKHVYLRYSPEITHTSGFHFFEKAKGYLHFLIALALCVLSFSFNEIEGWMLGWGERERSSWIILSQSINRLTLEFSKA